MKTLTTVLSKYDDTALLSALAERRYRLANPKPKPKPRAKGKARAKAKGKGKGVAGDDAAPAAGAGDDDEHDAAPAAMDEGVHDDDA